MNMKQTNRITGLVAGLLGLLLVANPAAAVPITVGAGDIGSSYDINWSYDIGGGVTLTAEATYSLTGFTANSATFGVSITNTTVAAGSTDITAFSFNTDPALTGASISGASTFLYASLNTTFPGFQQIEFCGHINAQSCPGGGAPPLRLRQGESDNFSLALAGDFSGGSLEMSVFPIRFIGDYGSFTFGPSTNGGGDDEPPVRVSEPAPLVLLGAGLIALAWARRRYTA